MRDHRSFPRNGCDPAALVLELAYCGFDGGPALESALDRGGKTAVLDRNVNLERLFVRRVVPAISSVGDDLRRGSVDARLDLGNDDCQGVAIIGIAWQHLGVQHELAALAAVDRRRDANLDAELVRLVGFSIADAFDLRRVQRVDLLATLPLTLIANLMGQRQRQRES